MIKKYLIIISVIGVLCVTVNIEAKISLTYRLQGLILLQVEEYGQAWYLHPQDSKRYYMGRPKDALSVIQELGLGITNENLNKIPVGIMDIGKLDTDGDGVDDELERLIGTDINSQDTDNDGYDDKLEIDNQYNPNGNGKIGIDANLIPAVVGRFLIQVEDNGEAWYLYPGDQKRYYVGRPIDALRVMQKLGLGISNNDLDKIDECEEFSTSTKTAKSANDVLQSTAEAVRMGQIENALEFFTSEMGNRARYSLENFDDEDRFLFANILSGAEFYRSDDNIESYISDVYFSLGGYETDIEIILEKQDNGEWLISSI